MSAPGLLPAFRERGALSATDAQTASAVLRMHRQARPADAAEGPNDELVALAAAFCVRALRHGSVAVDLTGLATALLTEHDDVIDTTDLPWPDVSDWVRACREHALVCDGPSAAADRPLRFDGGLLYLQKYWEQESLIAYAVSSRCVTDPGVDGAAVAAQLRRLFPGNTPDRQRLACAVSALRRFAIIAGGPGTGKTTTVAKLLALARAVDPDLIFTLAAPTGKAAARLQEATTDALSALGASDASQVGPVTAATLHRLLGWRHGSSRFWHNRSNPLPHDLVVIDECSMVPLTLMARLLEAVRPDATVILVGDPDQLASVDAGAVLADLVTVTDPADHLTTAAIGAASPADRHVPLPRTGAVTLTENWRFDGSIAGLAEAIKAGDADEAVERLREGAGQLAFVETGDGVMVDPASLESLRADVVDTARRVREAAASGDADRALRHILDHRLLCAHRSGPFGVQHWNDVCRRWIADALPPLPDPARTSTSPSWGGWPMGQPLIATANDYALGLFNGDTGVVVADPAGGVVAAFGRSDGVLRLPPVRLDAVSSLDAMTIHRGQGSQFAAVTVILPPAASPLLTRELLYTAITRAQERVRLVGSVAAVRAAVDRRVARASGLRARLSAELTGDDGSPVGK